MSYNIYVTLEYQSKESLKYVHIQVVRYNSADPHYNLLFISM